MASIKTQAPLIVLLASEHAGWLLELVEINDNFHTRTIPTVMYGNPNCNRFILHRRINSTRTTLKMCSKVTSLPGFSMLHRECLCARLRNWERLRTRLSQGIVVHLGCNTPLTFHQPLILFNYKNGCIIHRHLLPNRHNHSQSLM